jgi:hypothetical protein
VLAQLTHTALHCNIYSFSKVYVRRCLHIFWVEEADISLLISQIYSIQSSYVDSAYLAICKAFCLPHTQIDLSLRYYQLFHNIDSSHLALPAVLSSVLSPIHADCALSILYIGSMSIM